MKEYDLPIDPPESVYDRYDIADKPPIGWTIECLTKIERDQLQQIAAQVLALTNELWDKCPVNPEQLFPSICDFQSQLDAVMHNDIGLETPSERSSRRNYGHGQLTYEEAELYIASRGEP